MTSTNEKGGAPVADSQTGKRTLPDHDRCDTHRKYKLSCDQYERLLARSGQRCEICRGSAIGTSFRKLFIDHSGPAWAVRGLLCNTCNTRLRDGRDWTPGGAEYLAKTWWVQECARVGMPTKLPPEPPIGSVIRDQFGTVWLRNELGEWRAERGSCGEPCMAWERIYELRGPHNMALLDTEGPDGDDHIRWAVDRVRRIAETCVDQVRDDLLDRGRHEYAHGILAKLDDFDLALYEARARAAAGSYEPTEAELERVQADLAVEGLIAERSRLWDIVMGFLHALPDGEEKWKRAVFVIGAKLGEHTPTDVMEEALFSALADDGEADQTEMASP